jgi:biopolymer transport protein ExbD
MSVKRKKEADPELELTPIMNLVTILIPVLLMAAQFVTIAVIDSTLPAIGFPDPNQVVDPNEEPPLNLQLFITDKGLTLRGQGADPVLYPEGAPAVAEGEQRPPTVPCKSGGVCANLDDYDWETLNAKLILLKDKFPKEQNVILVPDNHIHYEILVKAMDASRDDPKTKTDTGTRELFPYVVIAGGAP